MNKNLLLISLEGSRVQLAQGILQTVCGQEVDIYGAWITTAVVASRIKQIMEESDIPLGKQNIVHFSQLPTVRFDYEIAICTLEEKESVLRHGQAEKLAVWLFPDPTGMEGGREERAAVCLLRDQLQAQALEWYRCNLRQG